VKVHTWIVCGQMNGLGTQGSFVGEEIDDVIRAARELGFTKIHTVRVV
jgi:hypothetical protein